MGVTIEDLGSDFVMSTLAGTILTTKVVVAIVQ